MALYAEVVRVGLVGTPKAGQLVHVNVYIKNISSITRSIMVGCALEYGVVPWPTLNFSPSYADFAPGAEYYFPSSFVVPSVPVNTVINVHGYSYWYGTDGYWHFDDERIEGFIVTDGNGVDPPPSSDIRNVDIQVPSATYNLGVSVPFTCQYEYKGKAQGGHLTIEIGTGVYPSFLSKHTFAPISVPFSLRMDWTSGFLQGTIILPSSLIPGQTYSIRGTLVTDDSTCLLYTSPSPRD